MHIMNWKYGEIQEHIEDLKGDQALSGQMCVGGMKATIQAMDIDR